MPKSPKSARRPEARQTIRRRMSRRRRFDLEIVEDRTLLSTIVWSNMGSATNDQDGFNMAYGADAPAARAIVQRAIHDWNQVIQDFKYADAKQDFQLKVSALDLPTMFPKKVNVLGTTFVDKIDTAGKPFEARIYMDDNAANNNNPSFSWYFDAAPDDNAEFTGLWNRFSATAPSLTGNQFDFYTTLLHEMGHAVGFASDDDLAINASGVLTTAGIDQQHRDDDGNLTSKLSVFKTGTPPVTFTSFGGTHVYEGPADPAFPADPLNAYDLMNPAVTGGTRSLISDLDADILRAAYGYTIVTPSTIQTFLANFDPTTGELVINGDVETDWNNAQTFVDDAITIDRLGADLRVDIDGLVVTFPFASVTSWRVASTEGRDRITVDFTNGSPIPVGGALVDGGDPITSPGDSLTIINPPTASSVVFTPSTTARAGSVGIAGSLFNFTHIESFAFANPIQNLTYSALPGNDVLEIDVPPPGSGQNRISGANNGETLIPFTFSNIVNFTLDVGIGDDNVTVHSPGLVALGLQNFTVNGGDGDDKLVIQAAAGFGLPVAGGAFTYNAGSQSALGEDRLIVHAFATSNGEFRPDGATARSGRFLKNGTTLFTTGLERADANGFGNLALVPPNDGDAMTITPYYGVGSGDLGIKNQIAGSSGGVGFSILSFVNVTNVLIDSRTNNPGGLIGDEYTIDNPYGVALQATGLQRFTIQSGAGDDVLTINAADFRLPVAGGELLFDAGTGVYEPLGLTASNLRGLISFDQIIVNANVDFLLEDQGLADADQTFSQSRLAIAPAGLGLTDPASLGFIRLVGVEAATLNGGLSGNRIDGSAFGGTLVLNGGDGDDTLIGGSGHNELNAGDGDDLLIAGYDPLALPGLGSQNQTVFRGGGTNILRGGAGRNTFHVDLNGSATLEGGAGENLYVITNPAGGVVDPVGGITIQGAGLPTDVLQLQGGGGAGYNQTYLLGSAPGSGNIVTTNNHVPDGPTTSQFIRFSGVARIEDTTGADEMMLLAESAAAPIGGVTGDDLAAGVLNPTVGGLPFGAIAFDGKTAPMVQLADGRVLRPTPPIPAPSAPLVIADLPAPAPPPAPAPSAAPAPVPVPVPPAPIVAEAPADPEPIALAPSRPRPFRPLAARPGLVRTIAPRPTPAPRFAFRPIGTRPTPGTRVAARLLPRSVAPRPDLASRPLPRPVPPRLSPIAPRGPLALARRA